MMSIIHLPENILITILQFCNVHDLMTLNVTCKLFYRLIKDPFLWRHLCCRDFNVSLESCDKSSYEEIYKNVLHRYWWLLGLYQSQVGPFGGLLEVRFQDGIIEGVVWEATHDIWKPLEQHVTFCIRGKALCGKDMCLPYIQPHHCSLQIDKRKGFVTQLCSDNEEHIRALSEMEDRNNPSLFESTKLVFLNEVITTGLVHKPLILPEADDIPIALRRKDGSFPRQIITPGLFKGTYDAHGTEIVLFRYKDEHEIHGHKVTGDLNVHASKITVKILLRYPVSLSIEDDNSIEAMKAIEPKSSEIPLDNIPEQSFSMPRGCGCPDGVSVSSLPTTSIARYHGFGQVAYEGFHRPAFTPVQVVVFSNDLFGVIWISLNCFSLFSRVENTFTRYALRTRESCL